MRTARAATVLLAGALLAACQGATTTGSPYSRVPVGSTLDLRQPLTIPANTAGVYLQGGQAFSQMQQINGPQLQVYAPYCRLEVSKVSDSAQTVHPDRFTVTRVRHDVSYVEAARTVIPVGQSDGSPPAEIYATLLYLHSLSQPNVRLLRCAHYQYPPVFAHHLSIDQIRTALGGIAKLELAGSAAAP